jgi:hypothetical protein
VKARLFTYVLFTLFSLVIAEKVSTCIYCHFPSWDGVLLTPIVAMVGCFLIETTTRIPFEVGRQSSSIWGPVMVVWGLSLWTVVYFLVPECIHDRILANSPPILVNF